MEGNQKEKIIESICCDLQGYSAGYFLTLNTLTNVQILFETQIEEIMHWLNKYCYGRSYRRGRKRLKIVGVSEVGDVNQGLHIHLIVMHQNDTRRTFKEINAFIRKKWYRLIQAKGSSIFGSLVDLQLVGDIDSRVKYITKTFYQKQQEFNLQYF